MSFVKSDVRNKFAQRHNVFNPKYFSCKWDRLCRLHKYWSSYFTFLIKVLANRVVASFKVLRHMNINKLTVFALLFLHYEWHHIILGCWVMIREQWCWFDELCMKGLLSTLPSFGLGKARLLRAILMCASARPLCGPFWLSKLHKFRIHLHGMLLLVSLTR